LIIHTSYVSLIKSDTLIWHESAVLL